MVRKTLWVGSGVLLVLGLLFGGEAFSYVRTGLSRTREAVKNRIPVEFQLDRARTLIKELDPEIAENMHKIAKEEVALDDLRKQKDALDTKLAKSEKDLLRLNNDLQRGDSNYVYAGKSFSGDQVRKELDVRFERHKTMRGTSDSLRQIIDRREKGLTAAQAKLREMQASRQQLEVEVANLAARREMILVAKTTSEVCSFDDSALTRARSLLRDIDTRLGVDEKLASVDPNATDEIQLESESARDISAEVSQYFSQQQAADVATH